MGDKRNFTGRGAQFNTANNYLQYEYVSEYIEGLDEPFYENSKTEIIIAKPKTIVNKVTSPDVGMGYSLNPYQGCEHGCLYCYARNSHEYWGYSAGLDFERKIIVKPSAPALLEKHLQNPNWEAHSIVLSGNTDCYQPLEQKFQITRKLLEVFWKYKHPVGIITKNARILRDLDILEQLASLNLVHVNMTITSLDEEIRRKLEPRTATYQSRLKAIEKLTNKGIPVNLMLAPVIPGLTDHEIPSIVKAAANHGAKSAGLTIVRLNGSIGTIFTDWVKKAYPERADKILNQIKEIHGGKLNNSTYGERHRGNGTISEHILQLFAWSKKKYLEGREIPPYETHHFIKTKKGQLGLF